MQESIGSEYESNKKQHIERENKQFFLTAVKARHRKLCHNQSAGRQLIGVNPKFENCKGGKKEIDDKMYFEKSKVGWMETKYQTRNAKQNTKGDTKRNV